MAKFYVMSGGCRSLVDTDSPHDAAVDLIRSVEQEDTGSFVYVSEWGFGDYEGADPEGVLFLTEEIEKDCVL